MLFGAHVSVADGYLRALDYAESVGCECIQVFAKSPRQWHASPIKRDAAAEFVAARRERGFGPVFTHTAYLINLATEDPELRDRSIRALADELARGGLLEAAGVVTHVGSDPAQDPAAAARRVASAVQAAFEVAGPEAADVRLLLENTAGAGNTFGGSFAELAACITHAEMPASQLGICLDTCHAFAYGMPVHAADGWTEIIAEIRSKCGLERLGLIHANDCKFARGSHRDRHAWIGDGEIGRSGFEAMVRNTALADIAVCTEMSGEVPDKDAINVNRLKAMRIES
jgi:deoxyribonuclease IV